MATNPYYHSPHWKALREACLRRDGYTCTVRGCGKPGSVADHIETRPPVPFACEQDRLENLRTLCLSHDAQVKETRRGQSYRKQGGTFKVKGCTEDGWPLSPNHNK